MTCSPATPVPLPTASCGWTETAGVRLAAITWVQSQVRDPWQRELLYDLGRVRQWVGRHHPEADETVLLGKVHGNLMRMWADV